jgi:hypothetical protein
MLTLLHGSLEPLIYGLIIFLGIFSIWYKLTHGKWLAAAIEISVFVLVFKLHGGTMNGGFAATVAALVAGTVLPAFPPRKQT